MSSKLKKRKLNKSRIAKFLEEEVGLTMEAKSELAKEDKEDRAVYNVSNAVNHMMSLAVYDILGFKEKRLRKYHQLVSGLKQQWADGIVTTEGMENYCIKKKIRYQEWLKSIPTSQKLTLFGMTVMDRKWMVILDAAILAHGLFTSIVLKEHFKVSLKDIQRVLDHMKASFECYTTNQPKCKKPYLDNKSIEQMFADELKLDLNTGAKIA